MIDVVHAVKQAYLDIAEEDLAGNELELAQQLTMELLNEGFNFGVME